MFTFSSVMPSRWPVSTGKLPYVYCSPPSRRTVYLPKRLISDIMKNGLKEQLLLEKSYDYDSVLCGCVADVDFDGQNEILLGTFGQVSKVTSQL